MERFNVLILNFHTFLQNLNESLLLMHRVLELKQLIFEVGIPLIRIVVELA